MKTVLLAAGQVGLVEVGRAEELVDEESESEAVELVRDAEDEAGAEETSEEAADAVDEVADPEDEALEDELGAFPTKTAPRTTLFLTGVPALLFM